MTSPAAGGSAPRAATGRPGIAGLSPDDIAFLQDATRNGLAEVAAARLALEKGRNAQVKGFAQQMLDEHDAAQQALADFARRKGVSLPKQPSIAQRAKYRLLAAAHDEAFDRRYASRMGVDAHRDTLKLYERAASRARDAEVRALATRALPLLRRHLQAAQDLQAAVEKDSRAGRSPAS